MATPVKPTILPISAQNAHQSLESSSWFGRNITLKGCLGVVAITVFLGGVVWLIQRYVSSSSSKPIFSTWKTRREEALLAPDTTPFSSRMPQELVCLNEKKLRFDSSKGYSQGFFIFNLADVTRGSGPLNQSHEISITLVTLGETICTHYSLLRPSYEIFLQNLPFDQPVDVYIKLKKDKDIEPPQLIFKRTFTPLAGRRKYEIVLSGSASTPSLEIKSSTLLPPPVTIYSQNLENLLVYDMGSKECNEKLLINILTKGGLTWGKTSAAQEGLYFIDNASAYTQVLIFALESYNDVFDPANRPAITLSVVVPASSDMVLSKETLIKNWMEAYRIATQGGVFFPDDPLLKLRYIQQISYDSMS